jgi:hypothetical protein
VAVEGRGGSEVGTAQSVPLRLFAARNSLSSAGRLYEVLRQTDQSRYNMLARREVSYCCILSQTRGWNLKPYSGLFEKKSFLAMDVYSQENEAQNA